MKFSPEGPSVDADGVQVGEAPDGIQDVHAGAPVCHGGPGGEGCKTGVKDQKKCRNGSSTVGRIFP